MKIVYHLPSKMNFLFVLDDICELTLDNMINANVLTYDKKAFVKDAILKKHRHQYEGEKEKKHHNHHHHHDR